MHKKVLSFLLAGLLVLSLCIVGAPQVSASQNMRASNACVELIKSFEGFNPKVFYDYSQYSIGYGTACGKNDYPNGITEAEAEALLRKELTRFEASINQFASRYGLSLSQNQFDALASFTYNLGTNWMNNASTFRSAVLDGARGNDFLFAITQWSNAGGTVLDGLAKRRMAEANLYLNGVYSKALPSNYKYVLFDNNLDGAVNTIKLQGYDANITDSIRATPKKSGYKFVGWYTEPNGGACITRLDANTPSKLYAHWQTASGEDVSGDSQGHAVNLKVTVIGSDVNIRKGPGTDYGKNGKAQNGQQLQLTWVQPGGLYLWGKFDQGWICLDYTDYEIVLLESSPAANIVTAIGEIVDTDTLRVRARPTTSSAEVGTYYRGDKVNITLQHMVGSSSWGKTDKGWISLYYVKLTPVEPSTEPPAEEPTEAPTEEPTTEPTEEPTTEPTEPPTEAPTEPKNEVIATGKIVDCDSLRIREGAGTKYKQVGSLVRGTVVSLYEITGSGSQLWARMDKGWISMNYVTFVDADEESDSTDEPEDEQEPVTGYVVGCDALNVRAGVGTKYDKVDKLLPGTKVTILETQKQGSMLWGRIDKGWISMDYVQLGDKPPTGSGSGSTSTTKAKSGVVVNADEVNLRKEPGTSSKKVGSVKKGEKLVILETTQHGGATWGRTEKGWIHMHYVKLDSLAVPSGSVVRTVTASSLRIRSAPGTSNKEVGRYDKGTQVVILEQKKVGSATWGRTSKGWISMHYVK